MYCAAKEYIFLKPFRGIHKENMKLFTVSIGHKKNRPLGAVFLILKLSFPNEYFNSQSDFLRTALSSRKMWRTLFHPSSDFRFSTQPPKTMIISVRISAIHLEITP